MHGQTSLPCTCTHAGFSVITAFGILPFFSSNSTSFIYHPLVPKPLSTFHCTVSSSKWLRICWLSPKKPTLADISNFYIDQYYNKYLAFSSAHIMKLSG